MGSQGKQKEHGRSALGRPNSFLAAAPISSRGRALKDCSTRRGPAGCGFGRESRRKGIRAESRPKIWARSDPAMRSGAIPLPTRSQKMKALSKRLPISRAGFDVARETGFSPTDPQPLPMARTCRHDRARSSGPPESTPPLFALVQKTRSHCPSSALFIRPCAPHQTPPDSKRFRLPEWPRSARCAGGKSGTQPFRAVWLTVTQDLLLKP